MTSSYIHNFFLRLRLEANFYRICGRTELNRAMIHLVEADGLLLRTRDCIIVLYSGPRASDTDSHAPSSLKQRKRVQKNSFMVEWAASIVVGFAILTAGILVLTVVGAFITWLIAFVR